MQTYRNLVSDSALVHEAIELLRLCGGRTAVTDIADIVLNIPNLDPSIATLYVSDLIKDDGRLRLVDNEVELTYEDAEARLLHDTDFVVVDVETTGAKTPPGRITEIGAFRISQNRIVAEFQTLVNPRVNIPPFIAQLTGITNVMVKNAPLFADVAEEWLQFVDTAVLVAHNAAFDTRFINHELARVFPGRRMINAHLCTVALSRRILPELPNHRLPTVAEHFAITIHNRHRAAGDALATAEMFIHMLDLLKHHGVRNIAEARRFKVNGGTGRYQRPF